MTLHVHHLTGCSPVPLAHYLKALGILRLVAEQKDPAARGWWRDESFHLATTLDEKALLNFFLEEYRPTPLIAPWNGGSGFYRTWDEKKKAFRNSKNVNALQQIAKSRSVRFAPYRDAYVVCHDLVQAISLPFDVKTHDKKECAKMLIVADETGTGDRAINKDDGKNRIQRVLKMRLAENPFVHALFVLTPVHNKDDELTGELKADYPSLFGTGGNDGKIDFTSRFMENLLTLISEDGSAINGTAELLRSSLLHTVTPGLLTGKDGKVGQTMPGSAGGPNMVSGFGGQDCCFLNPWDFVLMLEGAALLATSLVRRVQTRALPKAAAPFAVPPQSSGYGSATVADEFSNYKTPKQKPGHGEQWMPLWGRPAVLAEIRSLFAEGRSQIGKRSAQRSFDFGRAIARFGVARGITAFQRYGYIARNGDAHLAVPLGRWQVCAQPHNDLIDDEVTGWVAALRHAGSEKLAPGSVGRAARACEEAILACCHKGRDPQRWQDLLIALGAAEVQLPRSPRFTAGKPKDPRRQPLYPLPRLSCGWLAAANDGSPELRLALALASQHGSTDHRFMEDSIRRHFLPLNRKTQDKVRQRFLLDSSGESLARTAEVVCTGDDLQTVCLALVRRRIVEARQESLSHLPLVSVRGAEASLDDLALLLAGQLDEARILNLARPLMALDWREFRVPWKAGRSGSEAAGTVGLYGMIRLAHWPGPLRLAGAAEPVNIRLDPAIFARLATGDLPAATSIAVRRLSASGLRPYFRQAVDTPELARRLAAALAFPISARDAAVLARRLTRPTLDNRPEPAAEPSVNPLS
jgi:CRISPR-associated protein Csx17